MKNFFVQLVSYTLTPFLLYMDYSTHDSAWLFIYGFICVIALIAYIMSIMSVLVMTYDKKNITTDTREWLTSCYKILHYRRYISYAYGVIPFLYLCFTHHFVLAAFSMICSIIAWILIAQVIYEYKQLDTPT